MKLHFYAKDGWYVERIKGRPITNLIRLLIHTRRISTKPRKIEHPGVSFKGSGFYSTDSKR